MDLASAWFRKAGYDVEDVHSGRPYDLLCTKGSEVKYVEVKGTLSGGKRVILTAGEVSFIGGNKPRCRLCVVHDIKITKGRKPKASGGRISPDIPFDLSAGMLSPINYLYTRPS